MNNKPVIITLIICILIAAAGLVCHFMLPEKETASGNVLPSGNPKEMKELFESKQKIVIDCLGDSITWGMYSSPELIEDIESGEVYSGLDDGGQLFDDYDIYISSAYQSDPAYPELLERKLNSFLAEDGFSNTVETVNDGICGDWITKETWERMSCDPDIVLFLMGGNNFYFHYPVTGMYEANLDALKENGKIIYLMNYPLYPEGSHLNAFRKANELAESMSKEYQLPLIDLYSMMNGAVADGGYQWEELFSPDRIHLSEKGYELIGNYIAENIYTDIKVK